MKYGPRDGCQRMLSVWVGPLGLLLHAKVWRTRFVWQLAGSSPQPTHGRHCSCTSCAQEDWTRADLAPCGMHGVDCPPVYAPVGSP